MKKYWKYTDGNARWKYDSPFENWLSYRADNNEFMKILYVGFYRIIDKKFYKKGLKFIDKEIERFQRICEDLPFSRKKIIRDMVYSLHRFGAMFDEYFLYEFYYKNACGREEYICDKYRYDYYHMMNKAENSVFFDNKYKAYEIFREFYGRSMICVNSQLQKDEFISFCRKYKKIIIKPIASSGGRNVKILEYNDFKDNDVFEFLIKNGGFVAEELIEQAPELAKFHPKSLNTVRVPVIVSNDKAEIFSPFIRFGTGNSVVDNGFAGGIFAAIDEKSGIVISKGRNEKGQEYLKHPDTDVVIVGFQVPEWEAVINLVEKLSKVIEGNRYTAYDLAYTSSGWIMVEGNSGGQFLAQIADKKGRKKNLMELINSNRE